jgi:lipooligosaccharide transport system permease protein
MAVTCLIYFAIVAAFGAVESPAGVLSVAIALLGGLAFGTPLMAYSASLTEDRGQFAMVMRFIVVPMTLFSGTMFPLTQLPLFLQWIGWISPLWHATELSRVASYGLDEPPWLSVVHVAYLAALAAAGWVLATRITARRLNR